MPIAVRRWLRRMRGGAQSHLVEAADGGFYVLKAVNNPQHRRVLINEWIGSAFLAYLGIECAPAALLEVGEETLEANPELAIQLGSRNIPVAAGWHYGSRLPGDPARLAVFDFLPDVLLPKVANRADFLGVYVFDKWTSNSDARQSIFFRARVRQPQQDETPPPDRLGFVAWMIDHGYLFGGPNWALADSPLQGLYHRRTVYEHVAGWQDFEPWLARVRDFPEEVIDRAIRQIPPAWFDGDESDLEALMESLLKRRARVADLIEDAAKDCRPTLFPNWK